MRVTMQMPFTPEELDAIYELATAAPDDAIEFSRTSTALHLQPRPRRWLVRLRLMKPKEVTIPGPTLIANAADAQRKGRPARWSGEGLEGVRELIRRQGPEELTRDAVYSPSATVLEKIDAALAGLRNVQMEAAKEEFDA